MSNIRSQTQWIMSYKDLRKAVGIIGIALPIILVLGKIIIGPTHEEEPVLAGSISSYYFTTVGSFFVGSLCAIGVFLIFYKGPEIADDMAGHIAGISAIGVALFPTTPEPVVPAAYQNFQSWVSILHLVFAAVFFLTIAYFCLVLFVKSGGAPTPQKLKRNKIYRSCGYIILVSLVLIAASAFIEVPVREKYALFLIFESIAVFAFGIAWLVKGEAIFGDIE